MRYLQMYPYIPGTRVRDTEYRFDRRFKLTRVLRYLRDNVGESSAIVTARMMGFNNNLSDLFSAVKAL